MARWLDLTHIVKLENNIAFRCYGCVVWRKIRHCKDTLLSKLCRLLAPLYCSTSGEINTVLIEVLYPQLRHRLNSFFPCHHKSDTILHTRSAGSLWSKRHEHKNQLLGPCAVHSYTIWPLRPSRSAHNLTNDWYWWITVSLSGRWQPSKFKEADFPKKRWYSTVGLAVGEE